MKRAVLAFSLMISSLGCRTLPILDLDKEYQDTGTVMRRLGDVRCRLMIDTDHYGIRETETLDYEECRRYRPGMKIRLVIVDGYLVRIIGPTAP